jgi:hypothetical protein
MKSRSLLKLKKLILVLILGLISNQLLAQNNIGIFFQAVARDNYSNPAKSRKIYIQSSVIQSSATGTKVLIEEHQANTDATGMFNISIGNGNRVGGSATGFSSIDWSNGPFFLNLKVAITPMSGVTGWDYTKEWVDMGTTSFGAVPYALYAANAAGVNQKLNISDTSNMLSVYAKAMALQNLATTVNTKLSIGDSLTKYVTPTMLAANAFDSTSLSNRINLKANATDVNTSLATKVDKVTGKELSTNDYTTAEKTKLAAITGTNTGDQDLSALATNAALALKANTTDVNTALALKANATDVNTSLATKVDKVTGKELSTNDYTTAEKSKLAAITGTNTGDQDLSALATNTALALKANTADVTAALNLKANTADVNTALATKVDKVTGKALSTNDYTTAEKSKLAAITGTNTGDQDLSALATNAALALKANTTDVTTALNLKANTSSLSTVATSGDYNDLTNKPSISSAYTLPTASASVLGGIKVGSNLSVDGNGVLSANINAGNISGTVTVANGGTGATTLTGLVKGNGTNALTAAVAGTDYQAPLTLATTGTGAATFSGTTLTIPTYSLPIADGTNLGGVKVGSNLNVDPNGVLTANINAGTLTGTTLAANVVNSSLTSVGTVTSGTISLTTDITTSGTLKAGTVTYPNIHGTNGQVLSTTGSGTLSWTSIASPDLTNYVTTNTAQTITSAKTFSETTTFSKDLAVNGITVGKGAGNKVYNTVFGEAALSTNTDGFANTANGAFALLSNTTGENNTAVGVLALQNNTIGHFNTAIGRDALMSNTTGYYNTAIGTSANVASGSLSNTTAIGYGASVSASNTIQLGNASVTNVNTSGNLTVNGITVGKGGGNQGSNIAFGTTALTSNTTGGSNTAIGHRTLSSNLGGGDNTAVGANALRFNTGNFSQLKGTYNTALGSSSLNSNTEGSYNTATGANALSLNTLGNRNTAIGYNALEKNTNSFNTAIGSDALRNNTAGDNNTATGADALKSNTTGVYNTAYGSSTLYSNSTGAGNTAIGYTALFSNLTDGSSKGDNNTAIGNGALKWNTTGSNNTASGTSALIENTTGSYNAAIGHDAGRYIFSMSLTDNTTSDYSVYLGSNTKASASNAQNETVIGYNAIGAGNNSIQLGNTLVTLVKTSGIVNAGGFTTTGDIGGNNITANGTVTAGSLTTGDINVNSIQASGMVTAGTTITIGDIYGGANIVASGTVFAAAFNSASDLRLKSNIAPLANSLATVMQLNPVHYMKKSSLASTAYTREENGFIAQEIQKILPFVVTEGTDENKLLSVDYNSFIPVLTKAIQEQQKQIEDQNAKIAAQQKQIEELIKLMKELKK